MRELTGAKPESSHFNRIESGHSTQPNLISGTQLTDGFQTGLAMDKDHLHVGQFPLGKGGFGEK